MANTYSVSLRLINGGTNFTITGNAAIKAIADYKAHNYITIPVSEGAYTVVPYHAVGMMVVIVTSADGEEIVDAFCVQDSGSDEGGDDEGGGEDPKDDDGK